MTTPDGHVDQEEGPEELGEPLEGRVVVAVPAGLEQRHQKGQADGDRHEEEVVDAGGGELPAGEVGGHESGSRRSGCLEAAAIGCCMPGQRVFDGGGHVPEARSARSASPPTTGREYRAALAEQLVVGAPLDHPALVHHQDLVDRLETGQPVGDQYQRAARR